VEIDDDGFVSSPQPKSDPTLTSMEGVFAAGTAVGPKDIVDTIAEASAAAMKAAVYLTEPGHQSQAKALQADEVGAS